MILCRSPGRAREAFEWTEGSEVGAVVRMLAPFVRRFRGQSRALRISSDLRSSSLPRLSVSELKREKKPQRVEKLAES